jgi:hypothetical protein
MLAALLLGALLDVPYMAQTPELCGGAAVAMVMRYWGARDVFPQDFTPLVNAAEHGIPTTTLTADVQRRGWQAMVPRVSDTNGRDLIRAGLTAGRPLIALIAVAPQTYHYVVIVGATDTDIVVHDPALAPFRVLRWTDFERAWSATDRWILLMLPPTAPPARAAPADVTPTDAAPTPCTAMVEHGVQLAIGGNAEESARVLTTAMALCPADPAPRRELAGLRFSQQRWAEAAALARGATRLAPSDTYAWQLAASSEYAGGAPIRALQAWNHAGEPRIDTVNIQGATRTPQPLIVRATGFEPRALLTPAALERAERRLQDLPAADNARVTYAPIADGRATINVFVDEHARAPQGKWAVANIGAHALIDRELRVDGANLIGAGDLVRASWRWAAHRPRVEASLALPSPRGLPGNIAFEAAWEEQTYAVTAPEHSTTLARDSRRRGSVRIGDWPTGWLRWQAGAALDHFNARGYASTDGALDLRLDRDRIAFSVRASTWMPMRGGASFSRTSLVAAWRSTVARAQPALSARASVAVASAAAPRALWPGAGTGQGRDDLLRAHPLLHDGIIDGAAFGRRVSQVTAEYARPLRFAPAGALAVAAFVDAARAWHRLNASAASPLYVDAGIGMRLSAPGARDAVRVDLAHGLRGGGLMLSAGWTIGWGR